MYQIRKCESVTTHYSGEVANLDPEKFRNLSKPYEGQSEKEFLEYIAELIWDFDDMESEFVEKLGQETRDELYNLYETPQTPFWYSTQKGSNEWYELGENDSEGEFEPKIDTQY